MKLLHSGLKNCNFDQLTSQKKRRLLYLYYLKVAVVTAIKGHGPF